MKLKKRSTKLLYPSVQLSFHNLNCKFSITDEMYCQLRYTPFYSLFPSILFSQYIHTWTFNIFVIFELSLPHASSFIRSIIITNTHKKNKKATSKNQSKHAKNPTKKKKKKFTCWLQSILWLQSLDPCQIFYNGLDVYASF